MSAAAERFWVKVAAGPSSECWLWTAALQDTGYGQFWNDGKCVSAHRFVYELAVGPIPEGLVIDHLCRVRNCVNPAHLEVVTPRVNTIRGTAPTAVNASKRECPQGHAYDGVNLLVIRGKRYCRTCRRQRNIEYRKRRGPVQLTPEQRARKAELQRLRKVGGA